MSLPIVGNPAQRWRAIVLGFVAGLAALLIMPSVSADEGPIVVHSTAITSQFPEGIFFQLNVESESEIESISVKFKAALPRAAEVKDYLEFEAAPLVDGELFWRTNTSARYIPPGSLLHVRFEIEDAAGNVFVTEPEDFLTTYRLVAVDVPARGDLVPDAHLAALARAHGVGTIYTHDRDFRRFPFLRVVDPVA